MIVLGLSIFLLGVDLSIDQIGRHMGSAIAKSNNIWIVVISGIILGFFYICCRTGLQILAQQVDTVTAGTISKLSIIVVVSLGIAFLLSSD
jgi:hypothetical protein